MKTTKFECVEKDVLNMIEKAKNHVERLKHASLKNLVVWTEENSHKPSYGVNIDCKVGEIFTCQDGTEMKILAVIENNA